MVAGAQAAADVSGSLAELVQVLPDAEAAAPTGDHERPDIRIPRLLEPRRERLVHGPVERVQDVGPVQRQREDAAVERRFDLGHGSERNP